MTRQDHTDGIGNDLDERITQLLGTVVATTPPPPELENTMLGDRRTKPNRRNPWIIGGVSVGAAAAIAGLLIIPNIDDETTVFTPSDTALPEVSTAASAPVSDPVDSAVPVVTGEPVDSVAATSSTPAVDAPAVSTPPADSAEDDPDAGPEPAPSAQPADAQPTIVSAGISGISMSTDGEAPRSISSEPTTFAVAASDGIYFEVPWTDGSPEPALRKLDVDSGEVSIVVVPNEPGEPVRLHDVGTVQGVTTILYSIESPPCERGIDPACVTSLRTFQPETGEASTLVETNAWEFSWSQYHLADNGIVFGAREELVALVPDIYNLSTGVTPTAASLGLDQAYSDCSTCPSNFTIDDAGTHVAWIDTEPADSGSFEMDWRIVILELATGERIEVPLAADLGGAAVLQIANVTNVDGEVTAGQAAVSPWATGATTAPLLVDLATGTITELTKATTVTLS